MLTGSKAKDTTSEMGTKTGPREIKKQFDGLIKKIGELFTDINLLAPQQPEEVQRTPPTSSERDCKLWKN